MNPPTQPTVEEVVRGLRVVREYIAQGHYEYGGRGDAVLGNADRAIALLSALEKDAARWRAVVGCMRVRVLGSAGLGQSTDPYAHIGVELWTRYDMEGRDCSRDRERLTQFADTAIDLARGAT